VLVRRLPPDVPKLPDKTPRTRWWRRLFDWLVGPGCVALVASHAMGWW
jgi:hypothetical protein